MKRIGIIGAGHPFKYQYQALKDLGYELVLCDKKLEKIQSYPEEKITNYKELINKVDTVLISTPPKTHFEIIKYFIDNNIFVICEKPLVTNLQDLKYLKNNYKKLYNILHFAYGEEIEWFIKNGQKENIKRIVSYINDPYIINNHIREESLNLHGSYLDETINPLSAISRILKEFPKYQESKMFYLENDLYDYKSTSKFMINNIPIFINVNWNNLNNYQKYIDIYYDNKIIRLDSFNQKVIDLTNNKTLFEYKGIRMYRHYLNGFKNRLDTTFALNINEAILKGLK